MRYIQYIFLSLILCISTVSCIEELDAPQIMQENEELTLVPRVKSFTNQYVTKSAYTGNETKIATLSLLVFDSDGKLVHLHEGEGELVTINKSMLNSPDKKEKLASATVVMFANISIDNIRDAGAKSIRDNKEVLTLDDMKSYTCHWDAGKTFITDLGDNFTGFPMVGGIKGVDLTATRTRQAPIEVALKILYAKINFTIAVAPGTENEGTGMNFRLNGYTVNNVSKATVLKDLNIEGEETGTVDESSEATASADYDFTSSAASGTATGTADLNGQTVGFTFYVAESRYNHNSDLKGIYPDDNWLAGNEDEDVKGWSSMSEAEKEKNIPNGVKYFYDDLIQQYKPKLAEVDGGMPGKGLATYVTLNGTYTDYRGTVWDVNYKVYLGKDNAHNFHVDRNSAYTNHITIKGIRNNGSYGEDQVWVDHRVDVSLNSDSPNKGADCVTITRETLIDSHIEVRPLRVKWEEDKFAGVRVYLPTDSNGALLNWIGIERFTGSNCQDGSTYCYQQGKSIGKRRYFTDDLIPELQTKGGEFGVNEQDGKKFIYLRNGDCAWIYFDENTFNGNTRNNVRTAEIKLEFVDDGGNVKVEETYNVKQSGLHSVSGVNDYLESYEEYLHSYDSADKYNLSTTPADYTQQGLAWGLTSEPISKDIIVSAIPLMTGYNNITYRYDYFHTSDQPSGNTYYSYIKDDNGNWGTASFGTGLTFTNRATENGGITIMDMGTLPESAYQYCLSKNKFKENEDGGVTMTLHWYLPDVYQLDYILQNAADNADIDFNSDDYYWSSQPSYRMTNETIGQASEVEAYARAVSQAAGEEDLMRSSKHRIRCLYSKDGVPADMTKRTPDGVGGLSTFIMKGYIDNLKSDFGYFKNSVKNLEAKESSDTNATWPNTNYPTKDNSYNVSGAEFNYVVTSDKDDNGSIIEGFEVDPTIKNNWTEYKIGSIGTGYFTTLATYPGVTPFTLNQYLYANAYQPSSTKNSVVETITASFSKKLTKILPSTNLDYLDHLKGGKMFNISFSKSDGTQNPVYKFDEVESETVTTNAYNWSVPVYKEIENKKEQDEYTLATSEYSYLSLDAAKNAGDKAAGEFTGYSTITVHVESRWEIIRIRYRYVIKGITYKKYYPLESEGRWTQISSDPNPSEAKINTDELRIYSGNSITISLSDVIDEENNMKYSEGYEITKVKVYFSGSNLVYDDDVLLGNDTYVYARFVDDSITLPQDGDNSSYLLGWDYDDTAKTQLWSGEGTNSITLTLAEYIVSGRSFNGIQYGNFTYVYDKASYAKDKYIVIDKIEVKCTKKSTE